MATVRVQGVTKQFGPQIVLRDVSLDLHAGETVGLIGTNGAGKTTLFRLLTGNLKPDLGTVTTARGVEIGHLPQEPAIALDRSLHDEVFSVFTDLLKLEQKLQQISEQMADAQPGGELEELMDRYDKTSAQFEAAGGHGFETRLNEILGGLGFQQADYRLPMSALSGGQKCRAALAKLLLEDRTLLLLDEPTNHLDIDAVRWLERFLAGHHGGAVIISHDRYLLDRLCKRIVEVEHGRLAKYPGNYSNYAETKHRRILTQQRQFEKDQAYIAKERDFFARYHAAQRGKQAQGRLKRLERRLEAGEFVTETHKSRRTMKLGFERVDVRQGPLLNLEELTMAFGDKTLFRDLSATIHAGERLGITGPNGTGKTTLLRHIMGKLDPLAGKVVFERQASIGYYAQEHAELTGSRSVVDELRAQHGNLSEAQARSLLGRYLFTGDTVFKPVNALSGGEQSRIRLALLIMQAPELLVLDEPTNHLDIPSREALEEALLEFPGTIIVVSHDRYFLDRIVDRLLVIRPEEYEVFNGNYSYYIETIEERKAQAAGAASASKKAKRAAAAPPAPKRERSPYDHLKLEELECLLFEREDQLSRLEERFGAPELYKDPDALQELQDQAEELREELAILEREWEQRCEDQ